MSLRHIIYTQNPTGKYKIAILIKDSCFNVSEIEKHYVDPLVQQGIEKHDIIAMNLAYLPTNKAPAKLIKEYLSTVLKACKGIHVETIIVADTNYFKTLTKQRKSEPHYGYILPCAIKDYEDISVALSLNYTSLFYDPKQQPKIERSLTAVVDHTLRVYMPPGTDVIHSEYYPHLVIDIEKAILSLLQYSALTVDIETYGLHFNNCGLATIAFAWDEHNGIAFDVDFQGIPRNQTRKIHHALRMFFKAYSGELIYHNATFDVKVLIYTLFMKGLQDTRGMLHGLDVMYKNTHCTKIITYLATNTTAGNHLSLKENAAEFAGNWALGIDDETNIDSYSQEELLRYNLVDCLSTWFVYKKNRPIMLKDQQEDIYESVYRPTMKVVTQMELTGMPMDRETIGALHHDLSWELMSMYAILKDADIIKDFTKYLIADAVIHKNAKLKTKVVDEDYFDGLEFKPSSNKQVGQLLHDFLDLPVLNTTATGLPSVGADSLKESMTTLMNEYGITDDDLTR